MKNLLVVFILMFQFGHAQKHDYNWMIGARADSSLSNTLITFSATAPLISLLPNSFIPLKQTNASISDSSGNFLFVTNGLNVFNKNFQPIPGAILQNSYTLPFPNGLNLPGTCIFLPMPGDTNQYVLIYSIPDTTPTTGNCSQGFAFAGFSNHLRYTILDKTLNSGLGGIVSANNIAFTGLLARCNGLATVKHANGRDWWIVIKNACDDGFHSLLLSPAGLNYSSQQILNVGFSTSKIAYASFSPDGSIYKYLASDSETVLIQFDRCSGTLLNPLILPAYNNLYSTFSEFSPNSRFLYQIVEGKIILQYDLTDYLLPMAVQNSAQVVGITDTFSCTTWPVTSSNYLYMPSLGPDGIIYISHNFECDRISRITKPDSLGIASAPSLHDFVFPVGTPALLCNNPNYRLGPIPGSICDSLSVGIPEQNISFTIGPNPVRSGETVRLEFSSLLNANSHLTFRDLLGRQIESYKMQGSQIKFEFIVPDVTPGIYWIQVQSGNKSFTTKLCVE